METRLQLKGATSLENETLALLSELEVALTDILAANPNDHAVRSRLTYLLARTDYVREKFAPHWDYLKDPPPAPRPITGP